jgi:hypothetical protein
MRVISLAGLIVIAGIIYQIQSFPISSQIAYQGILTDGAGNPLKDTTYNLVFSLHIDSIVTTHEWTENKTVTTKGGMFSHMLGSVNTFDTLSFSRQYWLSVKRGGDEIGQRIKLGVVPYARRAMVADSSVMAKGSDSAKRAVFADSAGKIDGKNIIANSIDSSKIANAAIRPSNIDTSKSFYLNTIETNSLQLQYHNDRPLISLSTYWHKEAHNQKGLYINSNLDVNNPYETSDFGIYLQPPTYPSKFSTADNNQSLHSRFVQTSQAFYYNEEMPTGIFLSTEFGQTWYQYFRTGLKAVTDYKNSLGTSNSHLEFWTSDAMNYAASEKMRIDKDGNVGINTTEPKQKLHISGIMRLEPQSIEPPGDKGDFYVNTSGELYFHNGTAWKKIQMQ